LESELVGGLTLFPQRKYWLFDEKLDAEGLSLISSILSLKLLGLKLQFFM